MIDPSRPEDIRDAGWLVAVHNDYRQSNQFHTFWLFTKGDRCVKGEGRSDAEALNRVRVELGLPLGDQMCFVCGCLLKPDGLCSQAACANST